MSYEHIEHEIKQNLARLKTGDAWFIPDILFDQAILCAYKQGILDGGLHVAVLVDKACEAVRGESTDSTGNMESE